jgi:predicted thioesterase
LIRVRTARVSELRSRVRKKDTAEQFGNDFPPAASTPFVLGLAELACHRATRALLGPNEITVGLRACVDHLVPTPVGAELVVTAGLTRRLRRRLYFSVEVLERGRIVARVRHLRAITSRDRVLSAMERP